MPRKIGEKVSPTREKGKGRRDKPSVPGRIP
jgi:hypothetical protein